MKARPAKLSDAARLRVRQILRGKRIELGRTAGELAVRAAFEIRRAHQTEDPTDEERLLWESLVIQVQDVSYFENFPAAPMSTALRRARLLGISMALGLDPEERAELNRVGGGV